MRAGYEGERHPPLAGRADDAAEAEAGVSEGHPGDADPPAGVSGAVRSAVVGDGTDSGSGPVGR